MISKINLKAIEEIALEAGEEALAIYQQDFEIHFKNDSSPITQADLKVNALICNALQPFGFPILSEENQSIPYSKRQKWEYYWCIDPIDGTKEFINKTNEWTINIALIHKNTPILGVVYAPALNILYSAYKNQAYKNQSPLTIHTNQQDFVIVASKSHLSMQTEQYINQIKTPQNKKLISIGSSLKLCLVAEGIAQIYPRLSPTMEWDTAAADAIVRACGKMCYNFETMQFLTYNKKDLTNPWFITK